MVFQERALLFHCHLIDMNMLCAHLNCKNNISAEFLIASHKDVATHCATQLTRIAETDPNAFNATRFLCSFEG